MKVFLIGLPGSGKTTLGRELSSLMKLPFTDLDAEIENFEHLPIHKIFIRKGETYFRQVESALLNKWCQNAEKGILATGGGCPCREQHMEMMNRVGITLYLNVSSKEICRRLQKKPQPIRPLLPMDSLAQLKTYIDQLLTHRKYFYLQARFNLREPISPQHVITLLESIK